LSLVRAKGQNQRPETRDSFVTYFPLKGAGLANLAASTAAFGVDKLFILSAG